MGQSGSTLPELNSHTYVKLTAVYLWDNLPLTLLAGVLFGLFSIPMFLFLMIEWWVPAFLTGVCLTGPAWTGLLKLEADVLLNRPTRLDKMIRYSLSCWKPSVRLGIIALVPFFIARWDVFL